MRSLASLRIKYIFWAALILSFHIAFTVYINSTYLSQFFTEKEVGYLYTFASIISILGFIISSSIIKKIGNNAFIITLTLIETLALVGLSHTTNLALIKLFFIIHQTLPAFLIMSLDLYFVRAMQEYKNKGRIRSLYLTVLNISYVLSPIFIGKVISYYSYSAVYLLSALCCIILFFITIDSLRHIPSHTPKEIDFLDSIRKFIPHKDLDRIFIINFLLQLFYAVMVIYTPIYLHQFIGFSWEAIGLIFTVMLVPFVLFEAPLGRFFDSAHTEKDTLMAGFIIMAFFTASIFYISSANIVLWMMVLFATRVGASFVEVAVDYSFFRRVSDRDAGFMSVFRIAGPLSYVIAPIIVTPIVYYLSIQYIFLCLGIIMISGTIFAFKLRTLR